MKFKEGTVVNIDANQLIGIMNLLVMVYEEDTRTTPPSTPIISNDTGGIDTLKMHQTLEKLEQKPSSLFTRKGLIAYSLAVAIDNTISNAVKSGIIAPLKENKEI